MKKKKRYRLTYSEIADRAGVDRSLVSHILAGRKRARKVRTAEALAAAVPGTRPEWWAHGEVELILQAIQTQQEVQR